MKKLSYLIAGALVAYSLQGCSGNTKTTQSTDSISTKDSTTKITATADSAKIDSGDVKFADNAAAGGMAEIALSKLAEQKSSNTAVKNFAAMMVKDHGAAGDSLMAIAKKKNIILPVAMDSDHQKKYDDMSKLTGADFDKDYINTMVDDHTGALKLMTDASANCKDADLKNFAAKTAPVVQIHLDAIKKIKAVMK
jgi:putative membrane protein